LLVNADLVYNQGMNRKVFKTGHSLAITLSKRVLENLEIKEGDEVEILAEGGRAVVRKSQKNTQLAMPFSSRPKLGQKAGRA